MSEATGVLESAALAVSIVNYRTSALVLQSLPALLEELSACPRARVFIVDNASPDGDADRLEAGLAGIETAGRVELIRSDLNGGFAAGNNIAFAAARALDWTPEAMLLHNPDAQVRPGAVAEMLRVMRAHPRAGFVAPRVENPDGSSWVGAFNFPSFGSEVLGQLGINAISRHFRITVPDAQEPVQVDWLTGTATLIRWEALEDLGDMDDGYFLYYEEVDYMLQGRRRGWESWHAPAAFVLHDAGAATGITGGRIRKGRQPAYWFQAWGRYFSKNHGPLYARATGTLRLGAMMFADLHKSLRGKPPNRPERYYGDFARQVLLARLSPPPESKVSRAARSR